MSPGRIRNRDPCSPATSDPLLAGVPCRPSSHARGIVEPNENLAIQGEYRAPLSALYAVHRSVRPRRPVGTLGLGLPRRSSPVGARRIPALVTNISGIAGRGVPSAIRPSLGDPPGAELRLRTNEEYRAVDIRPLAHTTDPQWTILRLADDMGSGEFGCRVRRSNRS